MRQEELARGNHLCGTILDDAGPGTTAWAQLVESADEPFFTQHRNYLQVPITPHPGFSHMQDAVAV